MIRTFFSTPNILGRLMIVLLFAGGVVFAGAFDGFVVETEASSCCGGGMDDAIFSSSSSCDEEKCNECGCGISGCSGCAIIGCGTGCKCPDKTNDSCGGVCSSSTDKDALCNNDCGL